MKRLLVTASVFLLAGCGSSTVKETLGIDRRAPDEFRVVSRPPLSVPPQFDLQVPSTTGALTGADTRSAAESALLGSQDPKSEKKPESKTGAKSKKPTASTSNADSAFLKKAGADQADPNVKKVLAEKKVSEQLEKEEEGWWDKVTVLPENKEPVVKAEGEAERLQKNKETGKPVTEGETPETGGGPVSMLKRWIGDE